MELGAFVQAAAQVGVPAVLAFLLLRSILKSHEMLLTGLLNHHAEKLDRIAEAIFSIRDIMLRGGSYDARPTGSRRTESDPEGEENSKASEDSGVSSS